VLLVGDLIYGNKPFPYAYLEQTRDELTALSQRASTAGIPSTLLTGSDVTRPVVIDSLGGVRFLHLSTHGFLENQDTQKDKDKILLGGVALSSANSGSPDSFLTADDIRQSDLSRIELVTLSACDTAKGNESTEIEGQGLLGFQTAFMAAGAKSLLFSIWQAPADEATTTLMDTFYDGIWNKHLPKAEALRQAQMRVRSIPRFADPREWASWVLVGEGW
jgi:CHAT domain-containing protein